MKYNQLQDVIEMKRKELIDVVNSMGFTTSEAVGFAIQEHYLGIPIKNDYSDDNEFEESFEKLFLRRKDGDLVYSYTMTEVLEHLYSKQIGKTYIEIKKYVYSRLEEEKKNNLYWGSGYEFGDEFKEWLWHFEDLIYQEVSERVADDDWNIIKPKK
jgi:hypothetical protein